MQCGRVCEPIPVKKLCSLCGLTRPVNEFRFSQSGGRAGARMIPRGRCRPCESGQAAAKYRLSAEANAKSARARYRAARARNGSRWPGEAYLLTGKYGLPPEFCRWVSGAAA